MKRPLDQIALDGAGCGEPGCTHDHTVLYLIPLCHKNAGTDVRYNKATGTLIITCRRCEQLVTEIAVAMKAGGPQGGSAISGGPNMSYGGGGRA